MNTSQQADSHSGQRHHSTGANPGSQGKWIVKKNKELHDKKLSSNNAKIRNRCSILDRYPTIKAARFNITYWLLIRKCLLIKKKLKLKCCSHHNVTLENTAVDGFLAVQGASVRFPTLPEFYRVGVRWGGRVNSFTFRALLRNISCLISLAIL